MASTVAFRYLKNRMTSIGGVCYPVRVLPARPATQHLRRRSRRTVSRFRSWQRREAVRCRTARLLAESAGSLEASRMDGQFLDRICDAAISKALEEREKAAKAVADLRRLVAAGIIAIIFDEDSILEEDLSLTDVEHRAAGLEKREPESDPKVSRPKPSQIIAAAQGGKNNDHI